MAAAVSSSDHCESPPLNEADYNALWNVIYEMGEEYVNIVLNMPIRDIPYAPPLPPEIKVHHLKHLLTVVPKILPSALYIEYHSHSQLQEGDIVAIHSVWGWQSFAMVSSTTGAGKMICFVNRNGQPVSDIEALLWRKRVRLGEVSMEEVLGMEFGPVAIICQKNRAQALCNARSILGREWSLFHFNSEHFVTWATTGRAKCHQLVNVAANAQKAVVTGVMTGLATPESCRVLKSCAKLISGAVAKETGEEVASSVTKVAATHLMKETAEEAVSKTTAVGLGKKMASGAKAGLFGGVVVEGACLAYSVHGAYQQMQRDEISQKQFRHHVVKQTGAAWGSLSGGVAGAAIASVIIPIPVVGTVIGSVVGGVVGSFVGSMVGEATDNAMFDPQ